MTPEHPVRILSCRGGRRHVAILQSAVTSMRAADESRNTFRKNEQARHAQHH